MSITFFNSIPDLSITIAADTVAWYGAFLSSCLFFVKIYELWRDRSRIKISYREDQQIIGEDILGKIRQLESGKTFWIMNVANIGNKNVIISYVGVEYKTKKGGAIISRDYLGPIRRFELVPGNSRDIIIDETLVRLTHVKTLYAVDATGKKYRKKVSL